MGRDVANISSRARRSSGYGPLAADIPRTRSTSPLRSAQPGALTVEDIMEFTLDGDTVGNDDRPPYLERFIHGSILKARRT